MWIIARPRHAGSNMYYMSNVLAYSCQSTARPAMVVACPTCMFEMSARIPNFATLSRARLVCELSALNMAEA